MSGADSTSSRNTRVKVFLSQSTPAHHSRWKWCLQNEEHRLLCVLLYRCNASGPFYLWHCDSVLWPAHPYLSGTSPPRSTPSAPLCLLSPR